MAKPIKVAVLDVLTEEFERRWRQDLEGLPVEIGLMRETSREAMEQAVAGAQVLITRGAVIDNAVLDAAGPDVALVIKLGRWPLGIDVNALKGRGIRLETVPQLGCITVAEHAMTLLLMSARDMIRSHLGVVAGDYREHGLTPEITTERSFAFKWLPVKPFEPYGKTLGIVGFGEIGKELCVRARAFGMRVLYFDMNRPPADLEAELGAEFRTLDDLLAESDFISLHIPHTPATEKLIGKDQFARMKNTAFLINCCRGGVIDEEAMVDALKTGEIAGAGLDVFVKEPLEYDHPLTKLDNVILSPHIGGGAGTGRMDQREAVQRLIRSVA